MRAGLFMSEDAVASAMFVWLSSASDDCWNGEMSDDPLHCYVQEQV